MRDYLLKICPEYSHLEESEMFNELGESVGWNSSTILKDGSGLGGGTSATKELARRIAIAETCERSLFRYLKKTDVHNAFLFNKYPSGCGFAFGFSSKETQLRSIAEACERWCWSKWIDEGQYIEEKNSEQIKFNKLSIHLCSNFDKIRFYERQFSIVVTGKVILLKIGIVIAQKGDGVFPGSRVCAPFEDCWEHGLIEAYRHLKIFQNQTDDFFNENIIHKRIKYFALNGDKARSSIENAKDKNWETPKLIFNKSFHITHKDAFLWRSICADFTPWSEGEIGRFVY